MNIQFEMSSNKSFDQAVMDLKENLSVQHFGVLWEMNFLDKLREKGLEFDTNFKVLEVCNPQKAKKVLDSTLEAGYFLPCKMTVYEKENKIYIGMLKPTALIENFNNDALMVIAKEVEATLKYVIEISV